MSGGCRKSSLLLALAAVVAAGLVGATDSGSAVSVTRSAHDVYAGTQAPSAAATPISISEMTSPTVQDPPSCSRTGPLQLCLATDKQVYEVGEPVHLTLEITTSEPLFGEYLTSCPADFFVTLPPGLEIWRLMRHVMCLQVLLPFELDPGETLTHQYVWDQRSDSAAQVPPGDYWARGQGLFVVYSPNPGLSYPVSAPAPFSVVASHQCGDTNCDGRSDAVDALFILQHVVGLRTCSDQCPPGAGALYCPAADVNGDTQIDGVDALFVLQCVVGLRSCDFQCSAAANLEPTDLWIDWNDPSHPVWLEITNESSGGTSDFTIGVECMMERYPKGQAGQVPPDATQTNNLGELSVVVGPGLATNVETGFSNFDLQNHDYVVYCTTTPIDFTDPAWNSYMETFI